MQAKEITQVMILGDSMVNGLNEYGLSKLRYKVFQDTLRKILSNQLRGVNLAQ